VTEDRQQALVDVRVLVLQEGHVLLMRLSADMFDGCWNLPGGHVMPGENAVAAAVRELQEEVGLHVRAENLTFRSGTHHRPPTRSEKVTFTFSTEVFTGEPFAAEPHRADVVRWTAWDNLPAKLMPQAAASLTLFRSGQHFATFNLGETPG
jgi:ADP-ribose pyrophosphatase YjhB (NUDIX family)